MARQLQDEQGCMEKDGKQWSTEEVRQRIGKNEENHEKDETH